MRSFVRFVLSLAFALSLGVAAHAQAPPLPPAPQTDPQAPAPQDPGWYFMQDAVAYGIFNHQGGARGGDAELKAPNWWMGMWDRPVGRHHVTLTTMLSLDPLTVGRTGYAELFQGGESLDGHPVIDRQHPHDAFMQLAAAWRLRLGANTGLTFSGGPAGEPALGPPAFMHRASAAENPTAPLGHHTFDSTHISYSVVTTSLDHGPWAVEGSVFNGREPDDHRWNLDLGPLDSFSGRVWFKPNTDWEFQVSSGFLKNPEALEPGNVVRTTLSGSWLRQQQADFTAVTAGVGVNRTDEAHRASVFVEATRRAGPNTLYGRFEAHQPETSLLLTGQIPTTPNDARVTVLALTAGAVRDVARVEGFDLGVGSDITVYRVPDILRLGGYGRPVSFHVFLRARPSRGHRMWNMHMGGAM